MFPRSLSVAEIKVNVVFIGVASDMTYDKCDWASTGGSLTSVIVTWILALANLVLNMTLPLSNVSIWHWAKTVNVYELTCSLFKIPTPTRMTPLVS